MKTSSIVWVVIIVVIVALGAWYFLSAGSAAAPQTAQQQPAPTVQAGINGSVNQGNLGAPDTGTPQQPQGGTQY